jgi:hypothetical protein
MPVRQPRTILQIISETRGWKRIGTVLLMRPPAVDVSARRVRVRGRLG